MPTVSSHRTFVAPTVWVARTKYEPQWTLRTFRDVTVTEWQHGEQSGRNFSVISPGRNLGLIPEECFLSEVEARSHMVKEAEKQRKEVEKQRKALMKVLASIPTDYALAALSVTDGEAEQDEE